MPTAPPPTKDAAVEARFFWERFKTEIAAVLVLVLLGIVGFGGYKLYSERRESSAAAALAATKTAPDYQQLIQRYGNTRAGADAYLLLADAQRNDRKFEEANATLQAFVDKFPKHELVTTARMAMGANLEAMGKTDEALAMYQKTATGYPNSFNAPLALLSQVHLLRAKNKIDEARLICEKLLTDYRESIWSSEAARLLRTLKPPQTAQNPAPAPAAPPLLVQPSPAALAPAPGAPPAPPGPPTPKTRP